MKKNFLFCAFIFGSLVFISCSKKNEKIQFDSLEPMAIEPGVEWLLVTSPYTACHKEAGYENPVESYLRRGESRVVEGSSTVKIDDNYEKWFFVKEGWIPENCAKIFSNKLRAQTAKSELR